MSRIRLGQLSYINCLPLYHALEEGLLPLEAELVKQPPAVLNKLLLNEQLEMGPVSSIEYARHKEKYFVLPDLSISADGRVMSVLLFSKVPVTELDGKRVCLTESSDTGVTLIKILFDHYYHVEVDYETTPSDLEDMLTRADGALLIGDQAMQAHRYVLEQRLPCHVTDLGEVWKQFTGFRMIYAIWVVRRDFAKENPALVDYIGSVLYNAKEIGLKQLPAIYAKARRRCDLPLPLLEDYYNVLSYGFDKESRKALMVFYDYAYKSGLIDERVRMHVWGEADA